MEPGRIQNSNNIIVEVPLQEVNFGDEYITDLMFDPGNTTLLTGTLPAPPPVPVGGSGPLSVSGLAMLSLLLAARAMRRQRRV